MKKDLFSIENLAKEYTKVLDMDNLDLINNPSEIENEIKNNPNEFIYNLIQEILELQENL